MQQKAVTFLTYKKIKLLSIILFIFSLGLYVSQTGGILHTEFLPQKTFLEKEYDDLKKENKKE